MESSVFAAAYVSESEVSERMRVCVFLRALGEILWSSWVVFGYLGTLWESPRGSLKLRQDHLGELLGPPCGPPGWPLGTLGPSGDVLGGS